MEAGFMTDEFETPEEELYIRAGSDADLERLVSDIIRLERTAPIVVLTARPEEDRPALDAGSVRWTVGDRVAVWFVPTGLEEKLARRLPRLWVHGGGARIFWAGVTEDSSGKENPCIVDESGRYGTREIGRFRQAWRDGPQDLSRVPAWVLRDLDRSEADLAAAHGELQRHHRRAGQLQRQVAEQARTIAGLREELEARPRLDGPQLRPEDEFEWLLYGQWLAATPDGSDRRPLAERSYSGEFIDDVERLVGSDTAGRLRIAWVCAMVACGRAKDLDGLQVHPLRTGEGPMAPQNACGEAKAYRCAIRRNTPGAPRMHWWQLPGGKVQFANVFRHDTFRIAPLK
jgi:hypothetical protein